MNLPEQPSTFRRPNAVERPWSWRMEDVEAAEITVTGELADQRFLSQADAESWVGESWQELAGLGVAQVSLLEHDRVVYGPMSLQP